MSFPELVGKLLAAGVEYYHVDYVGMRKTFYSADGDVVVTPMKKSIVFEPAQLAQLPFDAGQVRKQKWIQRDRNDCRRHELMP